MNYSVWPLSQFMTSSSGIPNHVSVPQVFWNVGIFYTNIEKSENFITIKIVKSYNDEVIYRNRP